MWRQQKSSEKADPTPACRFKSIQNQSIVDPFSVAITPTGGKVFSKILYFKVISSSTSYVEKKISLCY